MPLQLIVCIFIVVASLLPVLRRLFSAQEDNLPFLEMAGNGVTKTRPNLRINPDFIHEFFHKFFLMDKTTYPSRNFNTEEPCLFDWLCIWIYIYIYERRTHFDCSHRIAMLVLREFYWNWPLIMTCGDFRFQLFTLSFCISSTWSKVGSVLYLIYGWAILRIRRSNVAKAI